MQPSNIQRCMKNAQKWEHRIGIRNLPWLQPQCGCGCGCHANRQGVLKHANKADQRRDPSSLRHQFHDTPHVTCVLYTFTFIGFTYSVVCEKSGRHTAQMGEYSNKKDTPAMAATTDCHPTKIRAISHLPNKAQSITA